MQQFASAFAGQDLQAAFLDFSSSGGTVAEALRGTAAVRHVIAWPGDCPPPPLLTALDFAHCFLGLLRQANVSVPEVSGAEGEQYGWRWSGWKWRGGC